jgi:predicted glycosyltransferase involved in capsule biosynthesis
MNQGYAFTYIIGYRHKMDRINNLRRTLDWINGFSGAQVILVEQDKFSKIKHLNLKCQHIFVKSNMPYNRSWAFNVGAKYAKTNIICCGDSDLIMEPQAFIKGLQATQQFEMVSPYHSVLDLTQHESNIPLEALMKIDRPGRGETDIQKINISGGIAIFRKDAFFKIGGWSENFLGWGGEDDYQTLKVRHFLTWTELQAKCYHFYHDKEKPDTKLYQRTLQFLNKANTLTKEELAKSINAEIQKMGMKNKYDNFA